MGEFMRPIITSYSRYFALALILLSNKSIADKNRADYIFNEMSEQFGDFYSGSLEYQDLLQREFEGNNFVELDITDSSKSEISITQINSGLGPNKSKVIQRRVYSSSASIDQYGSNNIALIEQKNGQYNNASIRQNGTGYKGIIIQDGSFNEAQLTQCDLSECAKENHGGEVSILQQNDHNVAIIIDNTSSSYGVQQNGGDSIFINNNMNRGIYVKQ